MASLASKVMGQVAGRFAYPFVTARSYLFTAEHLARPLIEAALLRTRPRLPTDDLEFLQASRLALREILKQDVENIRAGIYPIEVLKPENVFDHIWRFPKLLREGAKIEARRRDKNSTEFSKKARALMNNADMPEYYKRNFHFQGDGYLSENSAELYEHQVEILFAGGADAMRRLIIAPMKAHFNNSDGEGLRFLEIGSGTGRATRFVRLAFPKAKIVSVDLSDPYLKKAQMKSREFAHHDFVEGDGANLPFKDETFDAVYSVFLFHELPAAERRKVVEENLRCLKDGGFYGLVDSVQLGDSVSFDKSLERFPVDFHEPFYKNYIQHPVEKLFTDLGLLDVTTAVGFASKRVSGRKKTAKKNRE